MFIFYKCSFFFLQTPIHAWGDRHKQLCSTKRRERPSGAELCRVWKQTHTLTHTVQTTVRNVTHSCGNVAARQRGAHAQVEKLPWERRTKMSAAEKINPFLSRAMRCVQHHSSYDWNGAKHAARVKFVMIWCNRSVYNCPRCDFRTKAELYSCNISPLIALTSLSLPASR